MTPEDERFWRLEARDHLDAMGDEPDRPIREELARDEREYQRAMEHARERRRRRIDGWEMRPPAE